MRNWCAHKWNLFLELMRWAEGGSCRHDAILRYFGDEEETLAGCGRCDVCLRIADAPDHDDEQITTLVRKRCPRWRGSIPASGWRRR